MTKKRSIWCWIGVHGAPSFDPQTAKWYCKRCGSHVGIL